MKNNYEYKKIVVYFNTDKPDEKVMYDYLMSESSNSNINKYVKACIKLRFMIENMLIGVNKE